MLLTQKGVGSPNTQRLNAVNFFPLISAGFGFKAEKARVFATMWPKITTRLFRSDDQEPGEPVVPSSRGNVPAVTGVNTTPVISKNEAEKTPAGYVQDENDLGKPELPEEALQGGVQRAEAITLTWTKANLITAYISLVDPDNTLHHPPLDKRYAERYLTFVSSWTSL